MLIKNEKNVEKVHNMKESSLLCEQKNSIFDIEIVDIFQL